MTSRVISCPACGRKNRVPAAASGRPTCAACSAALPWLSEADDGSFAEVVERSSVPVLVDLWAPWCPPCRAVSPAVERMASTYVGRLKVTKVNVDIAGGVATRFNASSIPTLLLIKDGVVADRLVGAVPEAELSRWVGRLVG